MICPKCDGQALVIDSRPDRDMIRRRRECSKCGHRFSTMEIPAEVFADLKAQVAELRLRSMK